MRGSTHFDKKFSDFRSYNITTTTTMMMLFFVIGNLKLPIRFMSMYLCSSYLTILYYGEHTYPVADDPGIFRSNIT